MSWSPDLFIGELRPWPDSVHVVRGKTDEARRYMPERKDTQEALERRIDELCEEVEALKRDEWSAGFNAGCEAVEAAYEDGKAHYEVENAKLRELCGLALVVLENNCSECAYFYDCDIVTDCKCVAPMKIRDELLALGIEVPS